MTARFVVLDIDTLVKIIRDHLGPEYLPPDVMPTKLRLNDEDRSLEVVVESEGWEGDQGQLRLDFQLKRYFPVSAPNGEAKEVPPHGRQ